VLTKIWNNGRLEGAKGENDDEAKDSGTTFDGDEQALVFISFKLDTALDEKGDDGT
jgi:hypothetical protein